MFEEFFFGGGGHALFERFDEVAALAVEEEADVADGFGVGVICGEAGDAGAVAALDVVLQTGARMIAGEIDVAAGNHEALVDEGKDAAREIRGEIWAEVGGAVFFNFAREIDAGIFFVERELDVRIGFIVNEADVEFRLIALDEIVFEGEGFAGIVEDDGVEVGDFAGERAGFGVEPAGFEEVGADATAEGRGFADVEDGAGGVFEEVDAGTVGEERGFFAGFHGAEFGCGALTCAARHITMIARSQNRCCECGVGASGFRRRCEWRRNECELRK